MSEDSFTQKEILLKVMGQMDSLQRGMSDQQLLLQRHIDASIGRDAGGGGGVTPNNSARRMLLMQM